MKALNAYTINEGFSLTYNMVVKGHGGKPEMERKEGEYTQFTVSLPLN